MRAFTLPATILLVPIVFGQSAPLPAPVNNLQGPWSERALERNSQAWDAAVTNGAADAPSRYEAYQAGRQEALARGRGRIGAADRERLAEVAGELERAAPGSFEAKLVAYHQQFPAPAAFDALDEALALRPAADALVVPRLQRSLFMGDEAGARKAAADLRDRRLLAPGLTLMAADLLASVDRGGVLLLGGDMDACPVVMVQQLDGLRADVFAVDVRLLGDAGYRQRVWRMAGAAGPAPGSAQALVNALPQSTARPVHLALSLPSDLLAPWQERSVVTGLTLRAGGTNGDMRELAGRWERMNRTTEAGPLSWNYLVPGSLLVRHYRSLDDERGAARTEDELRRIARAVGATDQLYRMGILQH